MEPKCFCQTLVHDPNPFVIKHLFHEILNLHLLAFANIKTDLLHPILFRGEQPQTNRNGLLKPTTGASPPKTSRDARPLTSSHQTRSPTSILCRALMDSSNSNKTKKTHHDKFWLLFLFSYFCLFLLFLLFFHFHLTNGGRLSHLGGNTL